MAGWIKLHRKIQEHWLFSFSEPDKALAFIDLVLSASFDDGTVMIKGRTYSVKKGQFLVAQTTLQKRWKWSQNKVKRFLNLLKNERMVDIETDERTSIITICNYLDYQSGERTDERAGERASGRTVERATDEQSNDIKRSKELQEGKEVKKKDNSQQADRFTPPTITQVDEYMQSICKGSFVEAEKFVDFYESKGWMVGKNKMKSWQAAVRNWVKSDSKKPIGKKSFELQDAKNFIEGF